MRALATLVLILLSAGLVACSDTGSAPGDIAEVASDGAAATPPEIPDVDVAPTDAPPESPSLPPDPDPRPGTYVLTTVEGPLNDPEASSIVTRTERGVEIDRFRLPGARSITAEEGGTWGLVDLADGSWAIFDAVTARLSLLDVPAEIPGGRPVLDADLAWWQTDEDLVVLRRATGDVLGVAAITEPGVRLLQITSDGGHMLVEGADAWVVDVAAGTALQVAPAGRADLRHDGALVTVVEAADQAEGPTVTRRSVTTDEPASTLATIERIGRPILLADDRVVVTGSPATLVGLGGAVTDLPGIPEPTGPPVVSGTAPVVVVDVDGDLLIVDVDAATVTAVPASEQVVLPSPGRRNAAGPDDRWLWTTHAPASSEVPARPGVIGISLVDGQAIRLLEDEIVVAIASVTADGLEGVATVDSTPTGAALVRSDGTTDALMPDATVREVVLHPDGVLRAVGTGNAINRILTVSSGGDVTMEIETARSPAWLRAAG